MKGKTKNKIRYDFQTSETVGKMIEDFSKENDLSYQDTINHFLELGLKFRRPIPKQYEINDRKIRQGLSDVMDTVGRIGTEQDIQDVFKEVGAIRSDLEEILDILKKKGLRR